MEALLRENQDSEYRKMQIRLIPDVDPAQILGVRTPVLREMAKHLPDSFLDALPHFYFEENQLHAFAIERIRDFGECLARVNAFLPFVDNWATCDQMTPKAFTRESERLLGSIPVWLSSAHPYTARFAMRMLMNFFLKDRFEEKYLEWVAEANREHYYVKMMVAWYFATALAFQFEFTLPWIQEMRLEPWTRRKAIQKALESYRISDAQKSILRALR